VILGSPALGVGAVPEPLSAASLERQTAIWQPISQLKLLTRIAKENATPKHESEKLSAEYLWILILDYGSTFALLTLPVRLGFAAERYLSRHTILLVAALVGFACHVCMSRLLIGDEMRETHGKLEPGPPSAA